MKRTGLVFLFSGILFFQYLNAQLLNKNDDLLREAIIKNDWPAVKKALDTGADINSTDSMGATPLQLAAYKGHTSLFKKLILKSADPKRWGIIYIDRLKGSYYGNLVVIPAATGNVELMQFLTDSLKLDINEPETEPGTRQKTGWTALQWAAYNGHKQIVVYLVNKGANPHYNKNADGYAALSLADAAKQYLVASYLRRKKADEGRQVLLSQDSSYLFRGYALLKDVNTVEPIQDKLNTFRVCYLNKLKTDDTVINNDINTLRKFDVQDSIVQQNTLLCLFLLHSRSIATYDEKSSWYKLLGLLSSKKKEELSSILAKEFMRLYWIEAKYTLEKARIKSKYLNKWQRMGFLNSHWPDFNKAGDTLFLYANDIFNNITSGFLSFQNEEKESQVLRYADDIKRVFNLNSKWKYEAATDLFYNTALVVKSAILNNSSEILATAYREKDSLTLMYLSQLKEVNNKINSKTASGISTDLEALLLQRDSIESRLMQKNRLLNTYFSTNTVAWEDVQYKLKEKEAAIEIIRYKEINDSLKETGKINYAAIIIHQKTVHPVFIELGNENEIAQAVFSGNIPHRDIRGIIIENEGAGSYPGEFSYKKIIEPLLPHLKNINKLYISPDGLLSKVNFSTIKYGKGYLTDAFKVEQLLSTKSILLKQADFNPSGSVMLYGGINYDHKATSPDSGPAGILFSPSEKRKRDFSGGFSFLPGTLQEVQSIYQILKKQQIYAELYTAAAATESKLKEQAGITAYSPGILHISTHGFYFANDSGNVDNKQFQRNKNPLLRSGLVFAGANGYLKGNNKEDSNDGLLLAQEVADLNYSNTSLVVLSACQTALGDIIGSEGVYGIQRTFKMSGASYIMASLWPVPDMETKDYMINFYKSLIEKKEIKLAYNITMQKMKEKYKDPMIWGAFVLIY